MEAGGVGGGEDGGGRENKRTSGKGPELARQPLFWLGRLWKIVPIPGGTPQGSARPRRPRAAGSRRARKHQVPLTVQDLVVHVPSSRPPHPGLSPDTA